MAEGTIKIIAKVSTGKAFRGSDENWYNVNDPVIPILATLEKGDEVVVTYIAKGTARYVSNLVKVGEKQEVAKIDPPKESTTGFACSVCGKELKDGKFKKCFVCNKLPPVSAEPKTYTKSSTGYGSAEDVIGKEVGCAVNAAASAAAMAAFADPATAAEWIKEVATSLLKFIRANK